jgi:hypothetical protein
MSTRVAITASQLLKDTSLLKRAALAFDRFLISIDERFTADSVMADLRWLADRGIVLDVLQNIRSEDGAVLNIGKLPMYSPEAKRLLAPPGVTLLEFILRFSAYHINNAFSWTAVILGADAPTTTVLKPGTDLAIEVVLKQLPQPDELTPWEAILDWRQDEDAQVKFARLKRWMNSVLVDEKKPADLEDELRYLIDEYAAHMRLHRMKANTGPIRMVIVEGAQFAENLLKVKWGKAAEQLFSFRERRVALLEAEQKAPGREIAYIVDAQRRFGRR